MLCNLTFVIRDGKEERHIHLQPEDESDKKAIFRFFNGVDATTPLFVSCLDDDAGVPRKLEGGVTILPARVGGGVSACECPEVRGKQFHFSNCPNLLKEMFKKEPEVQ